MTTDSKHNLPIAPNLLERNFTVAAPNRAWVSDITTISTGEGWLVLAGLKDLFSGKLVSYAMSERMTKNRVMQALFRGASAKRMESFWGTLKNELVHHRRYRTRAQAIQEITEYIEIFYNRQRKQARLGYLSPAAFTQQYYENLLAA